VVEAMSIGVPVVAANRGALPEVVGRAGRLVEPDDAEGLAEVLIEILASRSLRDRMREDGWRQAGHFTWDQTAAGLREAWRLALDHRRHRDG
jgi:glycosyltransferase involved in cell wall biosynthesis